MTPPRHSTALAALLIPVALAACGGGGSDSNDTAATTDTTNCTYNSALWTANRTWQIATQFTPAGNGTVSASTQSYRVDGPVDFRGTQALRLQTTTVSTTASIVGTVVSWEFANVGASAITSYGTDVDVTSLTLHRRIWFDPARQTPLVMTPGQSVTSSYTQYTEDVPAATSYTPSSVQATTTFVGRETVTVPAGTFDTCHLDTSTSIDGTVVTASHWRVASGAAAGLVVRSVSTSGTTVATSVTPGQ